MAERQRLLEKCREIKARGGLKPGEKCTGSNTALQAIIDRETKSGSVAELINDLVIIVATYSTWPVTSELLTLTRFTLPAIYDSNDTIWRQKVIWLAQGLVHPSVPSWRAYCWLRDWNHYGRVYRVEETGVKEVPGMARYLAPGGSPIVTETGVSFYNTQVYSGRGIIKADGIREGEILGLHERGYVIDTGTGRQYGELFVDLSLRPPEGAIAILNASTSFYLLDRTGAVWSVKYVSGILKLKRQRLETTDSIPSLNSVVEIVGPVARWENGWVDPVAILEAKRSISDQLMLQATRVNLEGKYDRGRVDVLDVFRANRSGPLCLLMSRSLIEIREGRIINPRFAAPYRGRIHQATQSGNKSQLIVVLLVW